MKQINPKTLAFPIKDFCDGMTKREFGAFIVLAGLAAAPDCPDDPTYLAITWTDSLLKKLGSKD